MYVEYVAASGLTVRRISLTRLTETALTSHKDGFFVDRLGSVIFEFLVSDENQTTLLGDQCSTARNHGVSRSVTPYQAHKIPCVNVEANSE